MFKKHSHCSYCGHPFLEDQPWPRRCDSCGQISFQNPVPVTVVLLPVNNGLLAIRRNIEPKKGMLALPGGYVNLGETWQEAGGRELLEEAGITVDPQELQVFRVLSAPDGTILIFALANERPAACLGAFSPTDETSECVVLAGPEQLAFPLHTKIAKEFFGLKTRK